MEHLERRGTRVPALGLGTWELRGDACTEAVEHALALGYRHLDTAQGYDNEEQVGLALARSGVPRDAVFLVTKVKPANFSRLRAAKSVRESLRKLRTDYVDLLLLHWPSSEVPVEETLGALRELQDGGAVRHVGVSNFTPSQVLEARRYADVFANQVEYHPYLSQARLLAQARELDYLLTAYSPVARGKVSKDPTLREIGEAHGKTPGQVALRWLVQQRVAAIPKAASAENRERNLDIFDFALSEEEMARVAALDRGERLVDPGDGRDWER
ncbi:aldo/keto reductase [Truepera radiovictrix]|uniref:Aldo/keto reductase n=1 Tax=Truepera radiovictrix (strain DSM 17093 / CIP 108686 / LMG 22925 / RQ-24) TaxID=649638 RepID=D7CW84_TRURR|nr:aldo/keto reductase [Truepera radiovictrix]ADI16034.1 aldo/keto reductase [Truepera radiovictrix DSM 17093]WMT58338.1 aldo/keto reductase [Truepera radiovictrix]